MPLEALLIPENLTDSDSDGIGGGTGCKLFLFISPCSLSWPHRYIFLAKISYVALLGLSNVHLRIRFLI